MCTDVHRKAAVSYVLVRKLVVGGPFFYCTFCRISSVGITPPPPLKTPKAGAMAFGSPNGYLCIVYGVCESLRVSRDFAGISSSLCCRPSGKAFSDGSRKPSGWSELCIPSVDVCFWFSVSVELANLSQGCWNARFFSTCATNASVIAPQCGQQRLQ